MSSFGRSQWIDVGGEVQKAVEASGRPGKYHGYRPDGMTPAEFSATVALPVPQGAVIL